MRKINKDILSISQWELCLRSLYSAGSAVVVTGDLISFMCVFSHLPYIHIQMRVNRGVMGKLSYFFLEVWLPPHKNVAIDVSLLHDKRNIFSIYFSGHLKKKTYIIFFQEPLKMNGFNTVVILSKTNNKTGLLVWHTSLGELSYMESIHKLLNL